MSLSDLLNVELHIDNLKMFNRTLEETLQCLGDDLDAHVLETM